MSVRASLGVLRLAQNGRTGSKAAAAVILASTYRAVLGPTNLCPQFAGETGSQKSSVAALAQQHFGASMDYDNLPVGMFLGELEDVLDNGNDDEAIG